MIVGVEGGEFDGQGGRGGKFEEARVRVTAVPDLRDDTEATRISSSPVVCVWSVLSNLLWLEESCVSDGAVSDSPLPTS